VRRVGHIIESGPASGIANLLCASNRPRIDAKCALVTWLIPLRTDLRVMLKPCGRVAQENVVK